MISKKLSWKVLVAYVLTLLSFSLAYLIRLIATRALQPKDFGLVYFVMTMTSFITILTSLGITNSLIYYYNKNRNKRESYLSFTISFRLVILIIAVVVLITLSKVFIALFKFPSFEFYRLFLVLFVVLYLHNTFLTMFQLDIKFVEYKLNEFIRLFSVTFLTLALFFISGLTRDLFLLAWIFGAIIAFAHALTFFIKNYGFSIITKSLHLKEALIKNFADGKDLFKYGFDLVLMQFLGQLFFYLDSVIITVFLGPALFAFYNLAYVLLMIPRILFTTLASFFYPLSSKKGKAIVPYLSEVTKVIIFISLPFSALYLLFSKEIVKILFTESYLPSASVLVVFAFFIFFVSIVSYFFSALAGAGKARHINLIYIAGFLFDLVFDLIAVFLPLSENVKLQLIALATGFGWIIISVLAILLTLKTYNINFSNSLRRFSKRFLTTLAIVIISSLIPFLIKEALPFLNLYVKAALAALSFILIYLFLTFKLRAIPRILITAFYDLLGGKVKVFRDLEHHFD